MYCCHSSSKLVIRLPLISSCSAEGKRTVTMDENFFTGYRKTIVKPEEILLSVEIPYSREVSLQEKISLSMELKCYYLNVSFNVRHFSLKTNHEMPM